MSISTVVPESVFRPSDRVLAQKSAEEFVLFDIEGGGHFALNDVGTRIWELTDGKANVREISAVIESEYNAPPEIIRQDVMELIQELASKELLLPVPPE